jgi:hypothetical protein
MVFSLTHVRLKKPWRLRANRVRPKPTRYRSKSVLKEAPHTMGKIVAETDNHMTGSRSPTPNARAEPARLIRSLLASFRSQVTLLSD